MPSKYCAQTHTPQDITTSPHVSWLTIANTHNLRSLLLQYSPINVAADEWISYDSSDRIYQRPRPKVSIAAVELFCIYHLILTINCNKPHTNNYPTQPQHQAPRRPPTCNILPAACLRAKNGCDASEVGGKGKIISSYCLSTRYVN